MKELNSIKYFNYKLKIQKELKKRILQVFKKYNHLETLELKNNYLNKYHECEKMINLINYSSENVDWKLINITELNQGEFFKNCEKQKFDYIDILDESPNFNIGVFLVPKGNTLPLHNHPNMFVISKVIWGSVLINCFDRTANNDKNLEEYDVFQAEEKEKLNLKINDIAILTPNKNNIHELIAQEDSAIFDIILPAYDDEENRSCDYYEKLNVANSDLNDIFFRKI
jgi:cysteamine dioxygenase